MYYVDVSKPKKIPIHLPILSLATSCKGSVFDLQNVYRHMQHNVRSTAIRAHKKDYPSIPLRLSHHGMV